MFNSNRTNNDKTETNLDYISSNMIQKTYKVDVNVKSNNINQTNLVEYNFTEDWQVAKSQITVNVNKMKTRKMYNRINKLLEVK